MNVIRIVNSSRLEINFDFIFCRLGTSLADALRSLAPFTLFFLKISQKDLEKKSQEKRKTDFSRIIRQIIQV